MDSSDKEEEREPSLLPLCHSHRTRKLKIRNCKTGWLLSRVLDWSQELLPGGKLEILRREERGALMGIYLFPGIGEPKNGSKNTITSTVVVHFFKSLF